MAFNRKSKINKSEFEESILDIARVTRVVAGGKRLSFRVTLVIGSRSKDKHEVGVGICKGKDVAQAIQKAINKAKKNLITIPVVDETIPHEVKAKYKASRVIIKPAKKGKGIRAGGAVRTILKLANISNANAKILSSSSNAINNARVTIIALSKLKNSLNNITKETKEIVEEKKEIKNKK